MRFAEQFRLSDTTGVGVRCDATGLYVGATALLERAANPEGLGAWRERPLADIDRDLSEAYGVVVTCAAKLAGVANVARALNERDVARAQVAALLLRFPDPPVLTKAERRRDELANIASRLRTNGLRQPTETASSILDQPDSPAARSVGSSAVDKLNPYHDERGRFTDAAGAASTTHASADAGAREPSATETPPQMTATPRVRSDEAAGATQRVALVTRLSCLDAFRACVQDAIFGPGRPTTACTAALTTCKSTGLPTIFAPGIVGQR